MKIAVAAAVNDEVTLAECLAASPDIAAGHSTLRTYRGYSTAGAALNAAIDGADEDTDALILAHQDVYLHAGFVEHLAANLARLNDADPGWAIAGQIGVAANGAVHGRSWSSGRGKIVGTTVPAAPAEVEAIDEMIIVVNMRAPVHFDENAPGFHLYGVDIVQIAKRAGRKSYVVPMSAIHFSKPLIGLKGGYATTYRYMQRKYRKLLPIPTLVVPLARYPFRLYLQDMRVRRLARGRTTRSRPEGSPAEIARRLGLE